jgi:hypothetical protein
MLKETVDEFFSREGAQLESDSVSSMVVKGDLAVFQLDQAPVDDCHSKDIGVQVIQGCL